MLVGIRSGACHRHTVRFVTGDFVSPFEKSRWVLWETIDWRKEPFSVVCAALSSPLCLQSPRFEGWWRPVRQASGSLQTRVGCNFIRRWFALQLSRAPGETSREENRTHIFSPGPCLFWRRLVGIPWHRVNSLLRKKKKNGFNQSLVFWSLKLLLHRPLSCETKFFGLFETHTHFWQLVRCSFLSPALEFLVNYKEPDWLRGLNYSRI